MPKWLLYSLGAVVDLVFAYIAYQSGREIVAAILGFACIFFIVAAIGSARAPKPGTS